MTTKRGIIAIVAAAAITAAAATAIVSFSSNNENRSKPSEGWQFENVTDIKKKETASSDTSSTGSMANVLLFADGTIVSLDRDSEIAEIEIATPGYGLDSGNMYTFGFSERIEHRIISFDDLSIGDEVRVEYMYFLNKDETLHGEYIVRGSVETRPSARNATTDG